MKNFTNRVTACGNALFSEHKGLTLELDTERTSLLIYDDQGNCGQFVVKSGVVEFNNGTDLTENWTDEDWQAVEAEISAKA